MKNISLIINIVLFIALGVLYFLYFSLKSQINTESPSGSASGVAAAGSIVYVNSDSLMGKYDMYFDMKKEFEDKQRRLEAELNMKGKSYENNVADYQDKAQKGLITRSKAQEMEQQLMVDQQNLMKYRDNLSAQLAEEQQVMNRMLINNIVEYLKEYNKKHNYQYVMSHAFGGNLLYVPDSLDITIDVLKGLNEKYSEEKDKK
jgi:outer membrane protein